MKVVIPKRMTLRNSLNMDAVSIFIERRGIYIGLLAVILISALLSPAFYKFSNILNVLRAAAVLGIVSIGQTYVILGGGIDLSVGATMGTVAIAISEVTGGKDERVVPGIIVCLVIGMLIGLLNGLLITKRNIPPFVTTLGMLIFVEGARFAYTQGIISGRPAPFIRELAAIQGWIPIPVVFLAVLWVIAAVVLYRTPFGRQLYALGGNRLAARFSGINVDRVTITTYILSGLFAAIAGLVFSGYIGYGDRYLGRGFDLDSIGAVIVGGTNFAGGRGSLSGTMAGVLLLTVLYNIVLILGLPVQLQLIVKGTVIIGAVALYSLRTRPTA